jgi:hypothetical protein
MTRNNRFLIIAKMKLTHYTIDIFYVGHKDDISLL